MMLESNFQIQPSYESQNYIKPSSGKHRICATKTTGSNNEIRKYLPSGSPISLGSPKRLIQAHRLGILEAKKIIDIFEKKKEENGTLMSDSFSANLFGQTDEECTRRIFNRQRYYEEELNEEVLLVEHLEDMIENRNISASELCFEIPQNVINEEQDDEIHYKNKLLKSENNYRPSNIQPISHADFAIQHNSIFNQEYNSKFERKRSVEIQHCEKDIESIIPKQHFEASIQCTINEDNTIGNRTDCKLSQDQDGTFQTMVKLKGILQKLIRSRRNQIEEYSWDSYIKELKTRHVSYENSFDDNSANFNNCKFESKTTSPVSSANRVQSTFIFDDFDDIRNSMPPASQLTKNNFQVETLRCRSPFSGLDSPHSCLSENVSSSKFKVSCPSLRTVVGCHRANPFCYPSLLSNSINTRERETQKKNKICRNIYSMAKPEASFQTKACRTQNCENSMYNIKNVPASVNPQLEPNNIRNIYFDENSIPIQYNQQGNVLMPVQEESYNSMANASQMKRKRTSFQQNNCEPNLEENIIPMQVVNQNEILTKTSLRSIDNKLDKLIESIHGLMKEVKSNKALEKKFEEKYAPNFNKLDNSIHYFGYNNKIFKTKSDPLGISGDKFLKGVGQMLANSDVDVKGIISHDKSCEIKLIVSSKTRTKSTNTITIKPHCEQVDRPKELKVLQTNEKPKNHHVICDDNPHALQITIDFLVKENTAVVENTDVSERKTQIEKSLQPKSMNVNTSINTEPFSLHDITKETFKRLLSYFPIIEYYWSFIPIPNISNSRRPILECDICKQRFCTNLELNEHKKMHNRRNSKNCIICRKDLKGKDGTRTIRAIIPLPQLFACQYCGKTFTRAYSNQLHEVTCRENKRHRNEEKSLAILT